MQAAGQERFNLAWVRRHHFAHDLVLMLHLFDQPADAFKLAVGRTGRRSPRLALVGRIARRLDPVGRLRRTGFRQDKDDRWNLARGRGGEPQQPVQMLLSMRLFCCSMARSSGVGPDACGTPGRGTVSPVEVR